MGQRDLESLAKEMMENVKKFLLVGFVLSGIILILLIWAQGLRDTGTSGSVLYQSTQASAEPVLSSQTSIPQVLPTDSGLSAGGQQDETPEAEPAGTATPTLSPQEIQKLTTEEVDQ